MFPLGDGTGRNWCHDWPHADDRSSSGRTKRRQARAAVTAGRHSVYYDELRNRENRSHKEAADNKTEMNIQANNYKI